MIETVVVVLLAAAALVYVARPVLAGPDPDADVDRSERGELLAQKRSALTAILDVEAEHDAGKLSDEDLAALRAEYEAEALAALRTSDATEAGNDDELEAEIAAVRARFECSFCGAVRAPGETCPRCGA